MKTEEQHVISHILSEVLSVYQIVSVVSGLCAAALGLYCVLSGNDGMSDGYRAYSENSK
jgi:hypothetical protein